MFRGLQSAASGMIAQQRRQDVLSQNLANLNTPGYKNDRAVMRAFPQMLLEQVRGVGGTAPQVGELPALPGMTVPIGSVHSGVYNQEQIPDWTMGTLIETGNHWDFAIADESLPRVLVNGRPVKPAIFFTVETPDGEVRYTRNGKFSVDAAGRLVTGEGYFVLDPAGERIVADESEPLLPTRLGLVRIDNPYQLVREGNGVYRWAGQGQPAYLPAGAFDGFSIRQGFLEGSNVDPAQTMADMMMTMRAYEANQKVIQAYDKTMELLNTVGRLS